MVPTLSYIFRLIGLECFAQASHARLATERQTDGHTDIVIA